MKIANSIFTQVPLLKFSLNFRTPWRSPDWSSSPLPRPTSPACLALPLPGTIIAQTSSCVNCARYVTFSPHGWKTTLPKLSFWHKWMKRARGFRFFEGSDGINFDLCTKIGDRDNWEQWWKLSPQVPRLEKLFTIFILFL